MSSEAETPDAVDGLDQHEDDQPETDDEAMNDTTMHDDEEGEGSRAFQPNGKPYAVPDEATDYSVFSNPPDLLAMRHRIFAVEEPIELSAADFDNYFLFVDNIWRKMRTTDPQPEGSVRIDYYACRLRRGATQKSHVPRPTPEGKQSRKKRVKEEKTCGMTMKVVYNPGSPETCTVSRAVDNFQKHSHDLDYIDATKRNTGVMDTARREATKGFLPASIFWKMWEEPTKMEAAGGKFMKVSDVRNVQYAWRQENQQMVLKAHTGFNATRAPRQRQQTPTKPFPASMQPGVFGRLEPSKPDVPPPRQPVLMDTLQYPDHARAFLEPYIPNPNLTATRTRPHVTLTWASSLDSRISLLPGLQTIISGPETKAMTHYLRSRHDAILIGVSTAIADDPALNCRLAVPPPYGGLGWENQPRPIIIDPHARLHIRPEMKVLKNATEGKGKAPWIVVAPGAMLHPQAVTTLKAHGGEYLMINDYHPQTGGLNWEGIFNVLLREGIKSIMIEGGGVVISELLKLNYAHLIDSVVLTIAPAFFGKAGVPVSPDPTFDPTGKPLATRLKDTRWQPMGEVDVVLCAHMAQDRPINGILPGIEEFSQTAPGPEPQRTPFKQPLPPHQDGVSPAQPPGQPQHRPRGKAQGQSQTPPQAQAQASSQVPNQSQPTGQPQPEPQQAPTAPS
ncbi:uncharacterized protein A1O9_03968 [Exophiala aquamarina CBS 119918]|uniref:2,5-diamino-6-ribosylamino-4(3H)-pyrimidinone 5'-phosphate reductase n=1 Tax=Exophiala aquamarina CBS 119918 TaxID=1182545 RepID=A0A072PG55_9EURO|nr:uncharacterized protein A1O9_03968 [Exophiala aquamarina CBS 119918]KEF59124.1 hypothetical protein A1O9_03968 [Exophiala aquamarina CBS 119918]